MASHFEDYRVSRVVILCKDCGRDVGPFPARHKCGFENVSAPLLSTSSKTDGGVGAGWATGLWAKWEEVKTKVTTRDPAVSAADENSPTTPSRTSALGRASFDSSTGESLKSAGPAWMSAALGKVKALTKTQDEKADEDCSDDEDPDYSLVAQALRKYYKSKGVAEPGWLLPKPKSKVFQAAKTDSKLSLDDRDRRCHRRMEDNRPGYSRQQLSREGHELRERRGREHPAPGMSSRASDRQPSRGPHRRNQSSPHSQPLSHMPGGPGVPIPPQDHVSGWKQKVNEGGSYLPGGASRHDAPRLEGVSGEADFMDSFERSRQKRLHSATQRVGPQVGGYQQLRTGITGASSDAGSFPHFSGGPVEPASSVRPIRGSESHHWTGEDEQRTPRRREYSGDTARRPRNRSREPQAARNVSAGRSAHDQPAPLHQYHARADLQLGNANPQPVPVRGPFPDHAYHGESYSERAQEIRVGHRRMDRAPDTDRFPVPQHGRTADFRHHDPGPPQSQSVGQGHGWYQPPAASQRTRHAVSERHLPYRQDPDMAHATSQQPHPQIQRYPGAGERHVNHPNPAHARRRPLPPPVPGDGRMPRPAPSQIPPAHYMMQPSGHQPMPPPRRDYHRGNGVGYL